MTRPILDAQARGNWTDAPCWYCSAVDAGRTSLVLGPFPSEAACRQWAYRDPADGGDAAKNAMLRAAAERLDPFSVFYAWGMVKMPNGHVDGVLSTEKARRLFPEIAHAVANECTAALLLIESDKALAVAREFFYGEVANA